MTPTKHISSRVSKRLDRRSERTSDKLDAAFIDLLHRRHYESIRVGDITRKARVGRATFYAHYAGKNDLLWSQLSRIVGPMLLAEPQEPFLFDCTPLFSHVHNRFQIYRSLEGPAGSRVAKEWLQDRVHELLKTEDTPALCEVSVPLSLLVCFVAATLHALISWWIEDGMRLSAAQMQAIYREIVGGALRGVRSRDIHPSRG